MAKQTMITNEDHDLLIELRTEMQNVRKDIKELNDGTSGRIKALEVDKADRKDIEAIQTKLNTDVENRIRALEAAKGLYLTSMVIYTAVGGTMIGLIIWHLFKG
ncbi:MAG: hypothetical protein WC917_04870 [Bacilli bacterium]|jgi:hypothetical protein